jgi:hypothetical protein
MAPILNNILTCPSAPSGTSTRRLNPERSVQFLQALEQSVRQASSVNARVTWRFRPKRCVAS